MFLKVRVFSPVRHTVARLRSDDEGVALAAVLGLSIVGLLMATLIVVSVVSSFTTTTGSRATVQAQAAAQAGVVAAYAGVLTPGSCATAAGVYSSSTAPAYTATVYVPSGLNSWQAGCPNSTSAKVRIVSTGKAATKATIGMAASNVAYVEAVYNLSGAGSAPTDGSIFNTGTNGAGGIATTGQNDNAWQVAGPYTPTLAAPKIESATPLSPFTTTTQSWKPTTVGDNGSGYWAVSPFGNAQWIYLADNGELNTGDWYYRYQFTLPDAGTASRFGLNLSFLADNTASEVWVNGVAQSSKTIGIPQNAPLPATQYTGAIGSNNAESATGPYNPYWYYGYRLSQAANTSLNSDWVAGVNSIIVLVKSGPAREGFLAQIRTPDLGLCNAGYTQSSPPVSVTCSVPSLIYNRNVTSATG